MRSCRSFFFQLSFGAALAMAADAALSAVTTVQVSLWDSGAMAMASPHGGTMMDMRAVESAPSQPGAPMGSQGMVGQDGMHDPNPTPGRSRAKGPMNQMVPMGVTLSTRSVPAGEVRLVVTNVSKVMVHELVISPLKGGAQSLPYDASTQKVNEDDVGHLGEVADLAPGKKGALTLTLKPGTYMLYCNIAGHYTRGMWTLLTVK